MPNTPDAPHGQIDTYGPTARLSVPPQVRPSQTVQASPQVPLPAPPGRMTAPPGRMTAPPRIPEVPEVVPRGPTRVGRRISLWWVLVGVLALLAATGWGAYAAYRVPAGVVTSICADLSQDAPTTLYAHLSPRLRAAIPEAEFTTVFRSTTAGAQAIRSCARQGAYTYMPGNSDATAEVALTRANGQQTSGVVTLVNTNGAWWVDGLSTTLVGVDVGALAAANAYCVDSTTQNIPALYALQSATLRQGITPSDFAALIKLHTTIDGAITKCAVTGLGASGTAQQASIAVTLTWAKLGQRSGTVTLETEGDAWVVSAMSAALEGSDLGALKVADRFCSDVASATENDAYSLFSAAFRGQASESAFAAVLNGTKTGLRYSGCQPNVSTFSATASSASIQAKLTVLATASHQKYTTPITFSFVLENGAWRITGLG